jgi:hypothetical protein
MTAQETEPLYVFARWMLGSHEAAFEAVCAAVEHAPGDPAAQLRILVADLTAEKSGSVVDRFEELDQILRTDSTVPLDLDHPVVRGDAQRLHVLTLELQRTCLMTALRGIPAARRAVFILLHIMGLPMDDCVAICESTVNAIRVLQTRATKTLEGYLTTRCEHLDQNNACHCGARLGGALEQEFVTWPEHSDYAGVGAPGRYHRVTDLYANLPQVRLPVLRPDGTRIAKPET